MHLQSDINCFSAYVTKKGLAPLTAVDNTRYVEITPDKDTGYKRFVFQLNAKNSVVKCYSFEGGIYTLLFDQ